MLHTENDCKYTVISTTEQDSAYRKMNEYNFILEVLKRETIRIELEPGISFMFSGKFLTHYQASNKDTSNKEDLFTDLASYGNGKLHNQIKATMHRKYK